MSKAQELAKCLDLYDDDQTAVHAAAELRRLDRVNAELREALSQAIDAMDMQDKREFGEFHISMATALGIWRDAQAKARAALSSSGGNES